MLNQTHDPKVICVGSDRAAECATTARFFEFYLRPINFDQFETGIMKSPKKQLKNFMKKEAGDGFNLEILDKWRQMELSKLLTERKTW